MQPVTGLHEGEAQASALVCLASQVAVISELFEANLLSQEAGAVRLLPPDL